MKLKEIELLTSQLKQWGNFNSGILFFIKEICKKNNWPYGEIWLPDKNDEYMIWSSFWSKNEDYFERFSKFSSLHKFAKGIGLIGKSWEEKKLLYLEDISKAEDFLRSEIAPVRGLNSVICFPFIFNDRILCLLSIFLNKISHEDKENVNILFNQSFNICKVLANLD